MEVAIKQWLTGGTSTPRFKRYGHINNFDPCCKQQHRIEQAGIFESHSNELVAEEPLIDKLEVVYLCNMTPYFCYIKQFT